MTGRTSIWDRIDQDLNASLYAWSHLAARGLASQTVCRVLLGRFGLCACGDCDGEAELLGGDR